MSVSKSSIKITIEEVFSKVELKAFKKAPMSMQRYLTILTALLHDQNLKQRNKKAIWLPSKAENPDPVHMTFYGKALEDIPNKELPGERWGCQCAIGYR